MLPLSNWLIQVLLPPCGVLLMGFPVIDNSGNLYGTVILQDVEKVLSDDVVNIKKMNVTDVAITDLVITHP